MSLSNQKRCIVRDPNYEKLNQACHVWFLQQRSKGAPISGSVLKEKALQLFAMLYPDLNVDSFKASSGWLHKFSLRHGIKSKALHGESLSADLSCIGDFQSELHSKIESEGYTLNQIFNADETGLWWRLMPSKSLVHSGEKRGANFKKAKERVTLLGCANATGTCKLPLAFIHVSKKPRCFKNMDMTKLPVNYFSQKKAWMTAAIFEEWFHNFFVPYVKKFCSDTGIEYKMLLLVDNAPAHPSTDCLQSTDGKVTTMFLPANTTSVIQPMDQGILEPLKNRYKKRLLQHLIIENESSSLTIPEVLKQITIKDVVYWSAQAWDEASSSSLASGWKKLLQCETVSQQSVSDSVTAEVVASDEHREVSADVSELKSFLTT